MVLSFGDPLGWVVQNFAYSQMSGREGFGAIMGYEWCAQKWPNAWRKNIITANVTVLELFPIVVALHLWPEH